MREPPAEGLIFGFAENLSTNQNKKKKVAREYRQYLISEPSAVSVFSQKKTEEPIPKTPNRKAWFVSVQNK